MSISWKLKGLKKSFWDDKNNRDRFSPIYSSTIRNYIMVYVAIGLIFMGTGQCYELRVAISSNPNSLSPLYSTDANSQNIMQIVHRSLIHFDRKMRVVCDLCETFREEVNSQNQHLVTISLKKDQNFWDGEEITSTSVANSIKYFQDEKNKSAFLTAFKEIKDVKVKDKYNIVLVYPAFSLENVSNLNLLKIFRQKNNNDNFDFENLIGAGRFALEEVTPLSIKLKKIGKIDNKEIDQVTFKIVKDETTLALKIKNGEIDLSVSNISPRKIKWLKNNSKFKTYSTPSTNVIYLGLNHRREIFKSYKIRKAISHLINRENIRKYKLKENVDLSNGIFSQGFSDYYDKNLSVDEFNPKLAEKLFREEGFVRNLKSGIYEKGGRQLTLDWKVTNNRSTFEVAEALAFEFRKSGIKINLVIQEWGNWMKSMKAGQYDLVMAQWVGLTGPEILRQVFHSKMLPPEGNNRGAYINPQFDELVDRASSEFNLEKRIDLFKQAQKLAFSDYAYVTLWHPHIIWVAKECLKNVRPMSNGSYETFLEIQNECQ